LLPAQGSTLLSPVTLLLGVVAEGIEQAVVRLNNEIAASTARYLSFVFFCE
jgi:hypothetical protein